MIWAFLLSLLGITGAVSAAKARNTSTRDDVTITDQQQPSTNVVPSTTNDESQAQADDHAHVGSEQTSNNNDDHQEPNAAAASSDNHEHQTSDSEEESANDSTHHASDAQEVDGAEHVHHTADAEADVTPPMTSEEIAAFVHNVIHAEEAHAHDDHSALMTEHMELLDLVAREDATHIAIGNGSWFDPSNWHNGEVPGDDAKVLIPDSITMDYDQVSDARLFTLRIDGQLDFATDTDSKMVIDTFVVAPNGVLTIGTEHDPVDADVDVDIVIANNGAIDTDWDPTLISRGLISHGDVKIHGAVKDSHEKVIEDPMAGDTSVTFAELPIGWQVGDTIVIAGTSYDGYKFDESSADGDRINSTHEDEVRVISHIEGDTVHFADALIFDHDSPREDLKTSVANYTRNVSVETEDPDSAEIYERGHAMFMHSDDIDVRYAEFHELGRTDKSADTFVDDGNGILFDSNVKGRYGLHIHRAGTDDVDDPALVIGNSVFGSPGWGFVHHDSNAIFDNNASYDTFGAGFVAESGNEIGSWNDNIAIYAEGWGWVKETTDLENFDTGKTGDGFWFQGRMVDSTNNIAASVNNGYMYFHRGQLADDQQLTFDSNDHEFASAFNYQTNVIPDRAPILNFEGNETIAANNGLQVLKGDPTQGHDIHSIFSDFTAWNVESGAFFQYTSHYLLDDFDLTSRESDSFGAEEKGLVLGNNVSDFVITNLSASGFDIGLDLNKFFVDQNEDPENHEYIIIDPQFSGSGTEIVDYDPALDTLLDETPPASDTVTLSLDGPLVYLDGHAAPDNPSMIISGTKTDSLGTTDYPTGTDNFDLHFTEAMSLLKAKGYYSADDGNNYFVLDLYATDRLTGDIYKQAELVKIDPSVAIDNPHGAYQFSTYNGEIGLSDLRSLVKAGEPVLQELGSTPEANIFQTYQGDDSASLTDDHTHMDNFSDGEDITTMLTENQPVLDETANVLDPDTDHDLMLLEL